MNKFVEISSLSQKSFVVAIKIYLLKPQVINKKLNYVQNIKFIKFTSGNERINEIIEKLKSKQCAQFEEILEFSGLKYENGCVDDLEALNDDDQYIYISLDRIIPRNTVKYQCCYQLTVINPGLRTASFYALNDVTKILPSNNYTLSCTESKLMLSAKNENNDDSIGWLEYILLQKFHKWMLNYKEDSEEGSRIESLSLIKNLDDYYSLYGELKEKYASKIESIWTDETTDPKKFIYEDLSIAAYLISLWRQDVSDSRKQRFLDLGCGNGLLVYILSQEGYPGYGIDLRKRKLWDKYKPAVDLREQVFNPRESTQFDDVDFIIGNHTDELSPWIPVVAAKSSKDCKFFLLPCCAFEFSGAKFQRKGTQKSLYMSYIDYLLEICKVCGYNQMLIDRLKIPSTKRIALIGLNRSLESNEHDELCRKIDSYIQGYFESFIPRKKIQEIKNCTKINKSLLERIIKMIFDKLMSEENLLPEYGDWNVGGELLIPMAAKMVSNEDLKALKSECGGLQTLLRNKHQIFEVTRGRIRIRRPKKIGETKISERAIRRGVVKSSLCYFHLHHKQGCYFNENDCCYKH